MIPYKYYFYGSADSIDKDVLIEIPSFELPEIQEDRKILCHKIKTEYNLDWNINLFCVENGIVSNTIYPKTWVDSVNNSLYNTYSLHEQVYTLPIDRCVNRNKLLALYKTIRTVLAMTTKTHYRKSVKPYMNGRHEFKFKLDVIKTIDFTTISDFEQPNMKNEDAWKVIAFYIGQNISLIRDGIEIYTKGDLVSNHPELEPFIYRKNISDDAKVVLNNILKYYIQEIVLPYGNYISNSNILTNTLSGECIDMKKEIFI